MPALSKESMLAANDLPREKIDVPEWGGYVFVRGLTASERDSWESYCLEQRQAYKSEFGFPGVRSSLLVRCIVDDEGQRIFLDTDLESLGAKSGKSLDRLWSAATKLSGITPDDVEELKKN